MEADRQGPRHPRAPRAAPAGAARRPVVGVMGGRECDADTYERARELGRRLAEADYVLLCGGGSGVMEAAARGAREAGGLTIGVLPGDDADQSPPNPYLDVALFTGIGYARNLCNVLSSDVVVAVAGGLGTLSEIALGLKCGRPVVLLDSWAFAAPGFHAPGHLYQAPDPEAAVARVRALLAAAREGGGDGAK